MDGQFEIFQQGNCTVYHLNQAYHGKGIDKETLRLLAEHVKRGDLKVVVDLQNNDNIHVADIQALVRMIKYVNENSGKIAVVSVPPKVMEVLNLIKINAEMAILNNVEDGVHALN